MTCPCREFTLPQVVLLRSPCLRSREEGALVWTVWAPPGAHSRQVCAPSFLGPRVLGSLRRTCSDAAVGSLLRRLVGLGPSPGPCSLASEQDQGLLPSLPLFSFSSLPSHLRVSGPLVAKGSAISYLAGKACQARCSNDSGSQCAAQGARWEPCHRIKGIFVFSPRSLRVCGACLQRLHIGS